MIAIVLLLGSVAQLHNARAADLSSPCYDSQNQKSAPSSDVMRQMREMRPQANAPVQRYTQQQAQSAMNDYTMRAQQMTAPYIARSNAITAAGRSCRNVSCASSVQAQASQFLNDVTSNLVPQLQQLAAQARSEMLNSHQMSLDRAQELFRKQTGGTLPSSGNRHFYIPLCRPFRNPPSFDKISFDRFAQRFNAFTDMGTATSDKNALKSRIRDWNEKQAQGLGADVCIGTLAMGNVRCFKRTEDPQGYGRICERTTGGSLIGCYDANSVWTPSQGSLSKSDDHWASWFDRPPPELKLMAGGVPLEDLKAKGGPMDQAQKLAEQIILRDPVLTAIQPPSDTKKTTSMTLEPPLPFSVLEEKIRSGKGLSPNEIMQMSDSDRAQYNQLIREIQKESETPDSIRAGEQLAQKGAEALKTKYEEAAAWTSENKENIHSTIEFMEAEALLFGPLASKASKGIEAAALTIEVGTQVMTMSHEGKSPLQIATSVGGILGAEKIKDLGEKTLIDSYMRSGYSHEIAEQMSENTIRFADAIRKHASKNKGEHE